MRERCNFHFILSSCFHFVPSSAFHGVTSILFSLPSSRRPYFFVISSPYIIVFRFLLSDFLFRSFHRFSFYFIFLLVLFSFSSDRYRSFLHIYFFAFVLCYSGSSTAQSVWLRWIRIRFPERTWDFLFTIASGLVLGLSQHPMSGVKAARGLKLNSHLQLLPRLIWSELCLHFPIRLHGLTLK